MSSNNSLNETNWVMPRIRNWIEVPARVRTLPPSLQQQQQQQHPATMTTQPKEKKCGFCRCPGHIASNCNHPSIEILANSTKRELTIIYNDTMEYYSFDAFKTYLQVYLNKFKVLQLKMMTKYYFNGSISLQFNKEIYTNILYRLFLNYFETFDRNIRRMKINILLDPHPAVAREPQDICAICQEENITNDNFVKTNCCHEFCCSCVVNMIKYNLNSNKALNCPMCRTEITNITTRNHNNYRMLLHL